MSATERYLDPEVGPPWREIVEVLLGGSGPRFDADSLELMRSLDFPTPEALLAGRPFTRRDLEVPGADGLLDASLFEPHVRGGRGAAILWIHGGGMVSGNRFGAVEALDVAEGLGAVVLSAEYRLAPEHPSPAPGDDCHAVAAWFLAHAADLGVDPDRVVLGGASAGGGLAAATALRLRDEGGAAPAGLLLCCPMLDDRMTSASSVALADLGPWTRASNEFGWSSLLGARAGGGLVTAYEAPARAERLAGLPPVYLDVGSADLFVDEDVAFASRIWTDGGEVELHVWPGGYHGSELLFPDAQLSRDAFATRRRWLHRLLDRAT